jgi:hypothetical protein
MRFVVFGMTLCAVLASTHLRARADDPTTLLLDFSRPMDRIVRSSIPVQGKWKHYITQPGEPGENVRDSREVDRYITVVADDVNACQLRSRDNYVGLGRLLDPRFESARRLTWKWSVTKHPHNGKLGGTPNDQAILIYVFYREPLPDSDGYDYTGLGFCWTAKTEKTTERLIAKMPWSNSPKATIHHLALRDGPIQGVQSQEVDLAAEYVKVFKRDPPRIWGVVLLADSNSVTPDLGEMTTDAIIRDIRFHN